MFRKPSGKYNVGVSFADTKTYGTTECERKNSILFYYPSNEEGEECPYMDAEYQKASYGGEPKDNGVRTYCYKDVSISNEYDAYPVVIYNHGYSGFQMESTVLCADIASHGFVVASIGHPFGSGAVTFTDDKIFESPFMDQFLAKPNVSLLKKLGVLWDEDINVAIETLSDIEKGFINHPLAGHIMVEQGVTLLGVSFGGCLSIANGLKNPKVLNMINLDGGIFVDVDAIYKEKPILVLCSPFNFKAYFKLKEEGCKNVTVQKIKKVSHWEFSDGVYLSEKGKLNREWADRVSTDRSRMCVEFIKSNAK